MASLPGSGRGRGELVGHGPVHTVLWFACGMLWVVQATVPWTRRGAFSSSSMLDGVRLLRSGGVADSAPAGALLALVTVPVLGVLLAATAGARGRAVLAGRIVCVLIVVIFLVGFVQTVASADPERLGPGAWMTCVGVVVGVVGLASALRHGRQAARREEQPG